LYHNQEHHTDNGEHSECLFLTIPYFRLPHQKPFAADSEECHQPHQQARSVLLTLTCLEDDQIRVNVIPKKLKEGENSALTTPMSFTGTAAELDEQLPDSIVSFVASHLELKNTLARANEEMDAAAKAAQEEARSKAKSNKKPSSESARKVDSAAEEEQRKEGEPPRTPGLFDYPAEPQSAPTPAGVAPVAAAVTLVSATETVSDSAKDEEDEILAEIAEETSEAGSGDDVAA
jgi:PRTRC genetic system protein E